MTIENKELYKLYKSVKPGNGRYGLYLEGFDGGINAYVTDGRAILRKTYYGDNKDVFVAYYKSIDRIKALRRKTDFVMQGAEYSKSFFAELKAYFDNERYNAFTVDGAEFKNAVKGVSAINRGGSERNIVLSVHDGKFDLASWTASGDTAFWQLEGAYTGNGAVMVDRKYLDAVKSGKPLEFSYSKSQNNTVLHINGEMDAVIMPKRIEADDIKAFYEVLEYEYKAPEKSVIEEIPVIIEPVVMENEPEKAIELEKPELEPVIAAKTQNKPVKQARKPVKRTPGINRANGAFTGWTHNKLGTKQTKVCNW